jgi:hypothetical protein
MFLFSNLTQIFIATFPPSRSNKVKLYIFGVNVSNYIFLMAARKIISETQVNNVIYLDQLIAFNLN